MHRHLFHIIALTLAGLLASCAVDSAPAADRGPAVPALSGGQAYPLDLAHSRAAVLIFVLADCPISNAYAPEISRLWADYHGRGFSIYVIHVDEEADLGELRRHAEEFSLACPVLVDEKRTLARRLGMTIAPEAAVVGPDAEVLYRGRIDDRWPELGKQRIEPTSRDLRMALDAIVAGRPVPNPRTSAVGCSIAN